MKLTYIIPCYNGMPYVLEAVKSCLNQDAHHLIEVVLVDDGSEDGGADSVSEVFGLAENLKIIRQANKGESGAINEGLKHASGEFICVLSADDLVEQAHARLTLTHAEATGAGVIYPDWNRIDTNGDVLERVSTLNFRPSRLWRDFVCIPGPGAIISRAIIGESLRPELFRYIDDYAQWLVLSLKTSFERLPEAVAAWRHHPSQATQNSNGLISIEQWRLIDMVAIGELPLGGSARLAAKMAASLWVLELISKVSVSGSRSFRPSFGRRLVALGRFSLRHPAHVATFFIHGLFGEKQDALSGGQ